MRTLNKTKINSAILLVVSLAANNSAHALSSVAIDCGWVPGMTSTSYVLPCGYTTEYLDEMESSTAVAVTATVAGLSGVSNAGMVGLTNGTAAYDASKVNVVYGTPEATAAAANYKAPTVLADAQAKVDATTAAGNAEAIRLGLEPAPTTQAPAPAVTAPSKPIEAPKPVVQAPTPTVDVKPVEVVKPAPAVTAPSKPVEAPKPVVQAPTPTVDVKPVEIVKPIPVIQMPIVNAKPEIIKPQPIIEVEHEDVKPMPAVASKPVGSAAGGGAAAEVEAPKPVVQAPKPTVDVKPVEIVKPVQETVKPVKPVDTIVHNYAPTDTLHVYLSRNGNSFNPVLVNGGTQERVNLGGINKANLNGTEYGISYLQAPAQSMQDMGVLAKLITGQPAGVANLQASAAIGNTKDLINSYISSDIISSTIATLSAHDLAATLVKNALGSTDAGTIQWVEDFLKTHTLAELVELAVKNEAVIDHAFGSEGLMLI